MKLKDMVPEIRYVVKTNGTTLKKGDKIWVDFDGSLMNIQAGGWLGAEDWNRLRNEVELDEEYYKKEIEKMQAKIKAHRGLLRKHGVK